MRPIALVALVAAILIGVPLVAASAPAAAHQPTTIDAVPDDYFVAVPDPVPVESGRASAGDIAVSPTPPDMPDVVLDTMERPPKPTRPHVAQPRPHAVIVAKSKPSTTANVSTRGRFPGVHEAMLYALHRIGATQYACLYTMWSKESGWDPHKSNYSGSGAYGIPQALPGSKMATAGADWRDNPVTQVKWGLGYISGRYGTACKAWAFWQANHWY